ncbi:MAG: pyridoxine 5'-phosphate synthase [Planctomycetia bacterium]|nr:pyridoxine 5'-phosphate synthase [Planctomycetia bacterium]
MLRLGVNIDHVATIRQARRGREPDPVWAAVQAQLGGADGITIHLREDRRHIQDDDVLRLRHAVPGRLNLEMACSPEIVAIACKAKPDYATLVPEKRQELTTEGGLDVVANVKAVTEAIKALQGAGIAVSLFIDADPRQVTISKELGVEAVEFHTGQYADAVNAAAVAEEIARLKAACIQANEAKLHVHLGHGLNYLNVQAIAALPHAEELNIGHSIVARAVMVGMERAVREMKELMRGL